MICGKKFDPEDILENVEFEVVLGVRFSRWRCLGSTPSSFGFVVGLGLTEDENFKRRGNKSSTRHKLHAEAVFSKARSLRGKSFFNKVGTKKTMPEAPSIPRVGGGIPMHPLCSSIL